MKQGRNGKEEEINLRRNMICMRKCRDRVPSSPILIENKALVPKVI